ncbi:carboxylesterase family protein [Actinocrispum sp. NPDC049592]|uniref:carboxylesterase family protein n=1 Tax=Actinocrispum sp. NPDC049592 TaxID=3154835 RepID=UPI00342A5F5E
MRTAPIRYATAARFARPQPAGDSPSSGEICPQPPSRLAALYGKPQDTRPQGEDCLNLSITTPSASGSRPVMVFLHGGAFLSGGGIFDWYDGSALSGEGDVVVVSVNYRLNAFGYLCLDGVSEGNLGLYDQVEALRWVQRNIARFGGDPARVTVFGQSAGAMSIRMLMDLAEARGLFHRAILQSPVLAAIPQSRAAAAEIGSSFAAKVDPLTAPAPAMIKAVQEVMAESGRWLAPPFLPVEVESAFAENVHGLDVLLGWNAQEDTAFPGTDTEEHFAQPVRDLVPKLESAGATAFTYRLNWAPTGSPYGATHCVDLPLLLGSSSAWSTAELLGSEPWSVVEGYGRAMRRAWATFAHTGTPGTETGDLPIDWLTARTGGR